MAAHNASRVFDLIGRLLPDRPQTIIPAPHHGQPIGHAFGATQVLTGEQIDSIWLQRVELRSPRQIGDLLEQSGFASKDGRMCAIFVDEKCGLIRAEQISPDRNKSTGPTMHRILRLASACQASALILATNDLSGRLASSINIKELVFNLYHTGDAIDVPLLDHISLTPSGWLSRFTPRGRVRIDA